MKGCLILSVVLSMACGEGVAMPKPVLWLRARIRGTDPCDTV